MSISYSQANWKNKMFLHELTAFPIPQAHHETQNSKGLHWKCTGLQLKQGPRDMRFPPYSSKMPAWRSCCTSAWLHKVWAHFHFQSISKAMWKILCDLWFGLGIKIRAFSFALLPQSISLCFFSSSSPVEEYLWYRRCTFHFCTVCDVGGW